MNFLNILPGQKTYITGILTAVFGGLGPMLWDPITSSVVLDPSNINWEMISLGFGMVFLRKGMK